MTKHILTKDQRASGLDTREDDHNLYIIDTNTRLELPGANLDRVVAILTTSGATIQAIQTAANDYLIRRDRTNEANREAISPRT